MTEQEQAKTEEKGEDAESSFNPQEKQKRDSIINELYNDISSSDEEEEAKETDPIEENSQQQSQIKSTDKKESSES